MHLRIEYGSIIAYKRSDRILKTAKILCYQPKAEQMILSKNGAQGVIWVRSLNMDGYELLFDHDEKNNTAFSQLPKNW